MTQTCKEAYGEYPYRIEGTAVLCGKDIHLSFTGGTQPHIGAVSLAVYEPVRNSATVSTISVHTHRDDRLAMKAAKETSARFRCTVTVTVGLHVDDAGAEDIKILSDNFQRCYERVAGRLAEEVS